MLSMGKETTYDLLEGVKSALLDAKSFVIKDEKCPRFSILKNEFIYCKLLINKTIENETHRVFSEVYVILS